MPNFVVWFVITRGEALSKSLTTHFKKYWKLYLWGVPTLVLWIASSIYGAHIWEPYDSYNPLMDQRSMITAWLGGAWFLGYPTSIFAKQYLKKSHKEFQEYTLSLKRNPEET